MSEDKKIVRVSDAYIIDETARRRLTFWALVFLAAFLTGILIFFAMFVNQANNVVTKEDIKPLEDYSSELSAILNRTNVPKDEKVSNTTAKLKTKNDELISLISNFRNPDASQRLPQDEALKKLDDIALNLAIIQTELNADKNLAADKLTKINGQIKTLQDKSTSRTSLQTTALAFLSFLGNTLVAIIYPVIILIIILILLFNRKAYFRLNDFFNRFKSVKLFSTEFVLSEETKDRAEDTLSVYRRQVKGEYDSWVLRKSINSIFRQVLVEIRELIDADRAIRKKKAKPEDKDYKLKEYRATLHVPDLLFAETFYQLLDYHPRSSLHANTSGRTWSIRFGLIGKVWRSGESEILGTVPTQKDELIQDWGMTEDEAELSGKGRKSFICILLQENNINVGMFYMDAPEEDAFAGVSEEDLELKIKNDMERKISEELKPEIEKRLKLRIETELDSKIKQELKPEFDKKVKELTDEEIKKLSGGSQSAEPLPPPLDAATMEKINNEAKNFLKSKVEETLRPIIEDESRKVLGEALEKRFKEEFKAELREQAERDLREKICKICERRKLTKALFEINDDLGGRAPLIRIYNEY
jgi:uncharacterized integral membrane protein/ribosomal protein S13